MLREYVYSIIASDIVNLDEDLRVKIQKGFAENGNKPEGCIEIAVSTQFINQEFLRHYIDNTEMSLFKTLGQNRTDIICSMIMDRIKTFLFREIWSTINDDDYELYMSKQHVSYAIGMNEDYINIGFHASVLYKMFCEDLIVEVDDVQQD